MQRLGRHRCEQAFCLTHQHGDAAFESASDSGVMPRSNDCFVYWPSLAYLS